MKDIDKILKTLGFEHITAGNGCHEYLREIPSDDIYVLQISGEGLSEIKSMQEPVSFSINGKDPSVTPQPFFIKEFPSLKSLLNDKRFNQELCDHVWITNDGPSSYCAKCQKTWC